MARASGAFERLVPPWQKVEIAFREGSIHDGDRLAMDLKVGPFRKRWLALHSDYVEGEQFRDTQIEGPFRHWAHTHRVHPAGNNASILDDLPGGTPATALGGAIASNQIRRMFRFRHLRTRDDLFRHQMYRDRKRIRVAIVGSGDLAAQLGAFLTTGGHTMVANGQADFVVDLSHLARGNPTSPIDLRSSAAWISVLPLSADSFSTLRFPRHMTIWTPTIICAGPSNPLSKTVALIRGRFVGLDDDKKIPWVAADDLLGVIHSVMMDGITSGDVMSRAPTLASASEIQRMAGRVPSEIEAKVDSSEYGFHYLYPTIDSAVRAMNGRVWPT